MPPAPSTSASGLVHSAGSMQMCFGLCSLGVPDRIRIVRVQKVSRDEREIYYQWEAGDSI